jgi:hypothetical protein
MEVGMRFVPVLAHILVDFLGTIQVEGKIVQRITITDEQNQSYTI